MVTFQQIQELVNFRSEVFPVVSVYLNTDFRRVTKDQMRIILKDLMKARDQELRAQALTHQQQTSLREDFKKLEYFVTNELFPEEHRGYAIFSCSGKNFWQVYPLPQRVKNALIVDPDIYVRPLLAILNQFHRFAFVIVDQRRAQLFEMYMGKIEEYSHLISPDVPGKVRYAGWYGLEEKRVHRHIEQHVQEHYKRVSNFLFQLMNRHKWDYFILGGKQHELPRFEKHLHRYILDRIIDRVEVEPFSWNVHRIKNRALEIELRFVRQRMEKMIDLLITDAKKDHKAALGLESVLQAANMGNIRLLMIEDDRVLSGYECFRCGFLAIRNTICPVCGATMQPMDDLFDEIVENTVNFNGDYYQVPRGTLLGEYGGIGAFLRFELPEQE